MPLLVKSSLLPQIPVSVQSALSKMPDEEQAMFEREFEKKMKSKGLMIALAILFPIQLFLLGKTGLGILFIITCGGMGFWWIAEIFLTSKRVREYNENVATDVLTKMKMMSN